MKKKIRDLEELNKEVKSFLSVLKKEKETATLVWLEGDLGSGKTTFVQNVASIFGIKEKVNSPTFVISKKYKIPESKKDKKNIFKTLVHIDAYRLSTKNDLENIGFFKDMKDPENIIFLEWGSLVSNYLPKSALKVSLKYIDEQTREISVR